MCVTTSSTVWLGWRGTSNDWYCPCFLPRQTRTRIDDTSARRSGSVTQAGADYDLIEGRMQSAALVLLEQA